MSTRQRSTSEARWSTSNSGCATAAAYRRPRDAPEITGLGVVEGWKSHSGRGSCFQPRSLTTRQTESPERRDLRRRADRGCAPGPGAEDRGGQATANRHHRRLTRLPVTRRSA
jgi:hypothetical protein